MLSRHAVLIHPGKQRSGVPKEVSSDQLKDRLTFSGLTSESSACSEICRAAVMSSTWSVTLPHAPRSAVSCDASSPVIDIILHSYVTINDRQSCYGTSAPKAALSPPRRQHGSSTVHSTFTERRKLFWNGGFVFTLVKHIPNEHTSTPSRRSAVTLVATHGQLLRLWPPRSKCTVTRPSKHRKLAAEATASMPYTPSTRHNIAHQPFLPLMV